MLVSSFSELLGYASIACWLGAQFPQVLKNIQRQSCEGIALPFLLTWLLGDMSNLIGCLLTHQLPFQTWLATYFCVIDCWLLAQYFYYGGGPDPPQKLYGRSRSRAASGARRLSSDASHYRTLSAVAGNVAAAAALAAHSESPDARYPSKRQEATVGESHEQPAYRQSAENGDDVDDAMLSTLSDSVYSESGRANSRKRVSWSQERFDRQPNAGRSQGHSAIHPTLQITASTRGRPLQRDGESGQVTHVEEQSGSRTPSAHRTSSRASRRGAGLVLLGVGALFGIGTLGGNFYGPRLSESSNVGRVLVAQAIPSPQTAGLSVTNGNHDIAEAVASHVIVDLPVIPSIDDTTMNIQEEPLTERIIGRIFAWLCTTLYLTSRMPQIWKNYIRKSVEGLSMYLFVFAFLGNFFYVCSILTSPQAHLPPPASTAFFKESLPYLLGSGGTFTFDITIVSQSFIYRVPRRLRARGNSMIRNVGLAEEEAGLLRGDSLADSHMDQNRPAATAQRSRSRTSSLQQPVMGPLTFIRSTDQTSNNAHLADPRPDYLRTLVLDYLCHSCYTKTALAFARDSAVRHLDADGDEIMNSSKELPRTSGDLTGDDLEKIQLRNFITTHIMSGRVDEAIALLNEHFPSVLCEAKGYPLQVTSPSNSAAEKDDYIRFSTMEPVHLSLNLRVLAFIEACRTVPLEYNASPPRGTTTTIDSAPQSKPMYDPEDLMAEEARQSDLLVRGQKLRATVELLPKPHDYASYMKELSNVSGLLAYKVPETSPMSKYLHQERRNRVADQINMAILYRSNMPAVSHLELGVRYTSALWDSLHEMHIKPPPTSTGPPGVRLPPFKGQSSSSADKESTTDVSYL
ncbi:PQ loop repeat-domain-containing protein [Hygrophoropsis aurantiaca]|uniref:PQ loop repeat-domain-containing protein n=1 Tax=Hygrophoropsis aurantiaca TaxID=72124 RepID=A0ACB8AJN4_9AGAM|nr:PQ loop repeat-domain-containing protein [Hygrophoropsis aurantiaca]